MNHNLVYGLDRKCWILFSITNSASVKNFSIARPLELLCLPYQLMLCAFRSLSSYTWRVRAMHFANKEHLRLFFYLDDWSFLLALTPSSFPAMSSTDGSYEVGIQVMFNLEKNAATVTKLAVSSKNIVIWNFKTFAAFQPCFV